MKLTLLEIVQRVLSAMEADNVNSISATAESVAISKIAEEVYYDLLGTTDWPHLEKTGQLINSGLLSQPNLLHIPEDVKFIKELWYEGKELRFKEPEDFIRYVNGRNQEDEDYEVITTPSGAKLTINIKQDPVFFTIFNGTELVTDSYNSDTHQTLLGSESLFTGSFIPGFQSLDEFIPDLPTEVFPTYLSMVKRAAFLYLRREASPHDERTSVSGLGRILRDKYKLYRKENKISYGRKK